VLCARLAVRLPITNKNENTTNKQIVILIFTESLPIGIARESKGNLALRRAAFSNKKSNR
jgi:hypothetical protein